jgi:hypothetical protein
VVWIFWGRDSFSFQPCFLHLRYPKSTSCSACQQEEHAQDWNELQHQCHRSKPRVLHFSSLDILLPLLLAQPKQLEVPPVMERTSSVSCDDEEDRYTNERYEIDGQENDELDDLSEAEGAVNCTFRWLSKHLSRILYIIVECSGLAHKILEAFVDEDRIKNVYQSFVDQEGFEKKCYDDLTLPKHQNGRIDPCCRTMEDV